MTAKEKKYWIIGVLCVLALGGGVFYFSNILRVTPMASEVVKKLIKSSSKKYIIEYDDLELNTLKNEIDVNNIRVSYDSTQFAEDDSTRLFFDLNVGRLNLNVNSLKEIAYDNTLTVEHAILESPKINLYRDPHVQKKEKNFESWLQAYQFISDYLQSLNINSFSIQNASFQSFELRENDTIPLFALDSINASFTYLALDSAAFVDKNIIENIEDFSVEIKGYKRVLPDSLYRIEVKDLKVDKKSATLQLDGVRLVPMYERYEFAQKAGYRKGRITLEMPTLTFAGIDFHKLVADRAFVSENVSVDALSLEIFSDKHMEEWKRYRKMIPEMLKAIPLSFRLDTIRVAKGNIKYVERPEDSEETGYVTFDDVYATLYHATNIVEEGEETTMVADVQTLFMNKGKLHVNINFPMYREDLFHTIKVSMAAMPLTELNKILEAAVNTSVKSGQLNSLEFTMELDQNKATGMMHFAYNDLKIELLGKGQDDPKLKEKIGSFLANLLVLKTDNPNGNKDELREGPIAHERNSEKAIFGYWVRALLSGVIPSVGIDNIPEGLTKTKPQNQPTPLSE